MGTKLNYEQKGKLDDRLFELRRMTVNGTRDFDWVMELVHNAIEGRLPNVPSYDHPEPYTERSWYAAPELQLTLAHALWPEVTLPEPPARFLPRTEAEVLLLHVPESFDGLWDKVVAPKGFDKEFEGEFKLRNLHYAPRVRMFNKPVWLGFDPEHGAGRSPRDYQGYVNLAAEEVLSALIQFPEWPFSWFRGCSAPNLAGYKYRYGEAWNVPFLDRRAADHTLVLSTLRNVASWDGEWASPSIREC